METQMSSLLGGFFDTEGFMPHGYCLLWKPSVFWLNLVSDAIIALSYYSIPFVLVYFAMRRRDLAFRWMFVMFGIFILGCGTTHVMGIWTLWNPDYAVDGLVKAATALVSILTAIMLWPLMPQALALPSPAQLAQVNRDLNRQIAERHAAEAAVRQLNDELEQRVRERSAELEAANARLRAEIQERSQAEERLKASETRYRQVVELIQEGIWIIADDKIAFANSAAARMFGVATAADLIGMSPLDMTAPEDRDRARQRFHVLLDERAPVPLAEMRLQRRDGRPVIAEIQSVPYSNDGHPAILAVARDMTQRREMEEQLRQSQKMEAIGQLTGGLAHDFNNLLTVVIGGLDRLESSVADNPAAREVLQLALSAGLRGAELTRQLLAFARKQSLQPAVVDLNDLVANMTALLRRTLGEKVQMEVVATRGLWPAETDATQLESALANLAINARDAMPNGGRLTIETGNVVLDADYAKQNPEAKPGDYVMLAVSDTGTGIAPEHLPHVVEPFFTTKAPGKGSGLGLSMVYGFVKQCRGHMKIYSELGHGTVVRLYFPRAAAAVDDAAAHAAAAHAPGALAELVLVVEDNAEVRRTAITHLTDLGYRTLAAASGQEAMELLARTPEVDVVFTDIVMPGGMTGWELGEAARRLRPDIRILYTSGFSEASVQDGRAHLAAGHFLGKPYRKHELAQKLRHLLGEG
jgi:PAS domain S-box-containing protein